MITNVKYTLTTFWLNILYRYHFPKCDHCTKRVDRMKLYFGFCSEECAVSEQNER
jgi:hypothetical protein